ncbi:MAG: putative lipid II flippase FtsW [Spirochaetales bacterium]
MSHSFAPERVDTGRKVDPVLMGVLILLIGSGLSVLFSSSFFRAEQLFSDPLRFLRGQTVFVTLGVILASVLARVPLSWMQRFVAPILGVSLILMVLTFVPGFGTEFYGARRWIIVFGQSFQPSELVKVVLVLYLAYLLSRKQEMLDDPVNALLPPFLVLAVFSALIYMQNDFSTAVFTVLLGLAMFFVAGAPLRYFFGLLLTAGPLGLILLLTREHRVNRLLAYIDPSLDPAGSGYQVLAAERALKAGGAWGRGLGMSTEKLGSLPEVQSDFIFAVVAEETGYFGVIVVIGLFALFAWRGYSIAMHASDSFRSYLAFGLTTLILGQALLNIAVVGGAVPATGLPLPFFSSGGSATLMTLVACGLILNVSRDQTQRGGFSG